MQFKGNSCSFLKLTTREFCGSNLWPPCITTVMSKGCNEAVVKRVVMRNIPSIKIPFDSQFDGKLNDFTLISGQTVFDNLHCELIHYHNWIRWAGIMSLCSIITEISPYRQISSILIGKICIGNESYLRLRYLWNTIL